MKQIHRAIRDTRTITAITLTFLLISIFSANVLLAPRMVTSSNTSTTMTIDPSDLKREGILAADSITVDSDIEFGLPTWGGDGTPGNPWYINGLVIDLSGTTGTCIMISNTRDYFEIRNCVLIGGTSGYGIVLSNVTNGVLLNNTLVNHTEYAIHLSWSHSINVTKNACETSFGGIELLYDSSLVNVKNNTFNENTYRGLYCGSSTTSNIIKWNSFVFNTFNAIDDASTLTNLFDYNFWSDYAGSDQSPRDSIGDTPHAIDGDAGNSDPHPMMIPPTYPPIVWNEDPIDQIAQLGKNFVYDLNATAFAGIDQWWVNDTTHFMVNIEGLITNTTILPEGNIYGLYVHVNDTYGNILGAKFEIRIQDITPPEWLEDPGSQIIEFGELFRYDLNATDPSGIDTWLLNDTTSFIIDSFGLITNTTSLSVGLYSLRVSVNDTNGLVSTSEFQVIVQDTIAPCWLETPIDHIIEFGDAFRYDLNATDIASIDMWWIVGTSFFVIDSDGVITNSTDVPVDTHYLHVCVNDTHNQMQDTIIEVEVRDTTSPVWISQPENQLLECGNTLNYQLNSWDLSGIDHWVLNDTNHFLVSSAGQVINLDLVLPGSYGLRVTGFDPYGNNVTAVFTIIVQDTLAPVWSVQPADPVLEFGNVFVYALSAYDPTGLESWWLNDTTHFSISTSGVISNSSSLPVGHYSLNVSVNDSYDHVLSTILTIIVEDTTPPEWVVVPIDQEIHQGVLLNYQLEARDPSGIDHWGLNDTVRFNITDTGVLVSMAALDPGIYGVNLRVYDSYGNMLGMSISVTIQTTQPLPLDQLIGIGLVGGVVVVVLIGVIYFRKRSMSM